MSRREASQGIGINMGPESWAQLDQLCRRYDCSKGQLVEWLVHTHGVETGLVVDSKRPPPSGGRRRVALSRRVSKSSPYKGVSLQKVNHRWVAKIYPPHANRRPQYLGSFDTPEEAALAYNKAALELFGHDAVLNVIDDSPT